MKFNKWTLGLAAVGVVSMASAVQADETATKISQVNTALSNTTLSGYVDVAAQFNPGGGGNGSPNYSFGNKANSINLNVVDIALDKPLDESPWASGYHVELWLGPDASALGTSNVPVPYSRYFGYTTQGLKSPAAIRQAYIALRTPVGNGIDWKIGVWDTIIGYEGTTSSVNPNYSHSFGYNLEPTTHTGIQGTYKVCDALSVTAGLADDSLNFGAYNASVNGGGLYYPTVLGLVTVTAPDSFGWAKGATLTGGIINTSGSRDTRGGVTSWYAGFTLPTPVSALKVGGAFDYLNAHGTFSTGFNEFVVAGYGTFQINDKTSFNLRAELNEEQGSNFAQEEITATLQYNLWANVLTRLEFRWDHTEHGFAYRSAGSNQPFAGFEGFSSGTPEKDAFLLAAQAIYTF